MPDEPSLALLHKMDVLTAVLHEKQEMLGAKMDEVRAEVKGLRTDMQCEVRALEKRVAALETWQTRVMSNLNLVRWLVGTSGVGLVLSVIAIVETLR